jgi:hypothetical protein
MASALAPISMLLNPLEKIKQKQKKFLKPKQNNSKLKTYRDSKLDGSDKKNQNRI